jgi:hypothetical protein
MTESQRRMISEALTSIEIRAVLSKLRITVTEADVEQVPGYSHVYQLNSRAHQVSERERSFADRICGREHDDVLLLGNTPAIEGFFFRARRTFQLKEAGADALDPPPGVFVQAFLTAWQNAQGWRDVWLYISAQRITTEFARRRWNTPGTQPRLTPSHVNGQISRVAVFCGDGVVELPLAVAAGC